MCLKPTGAVCVFQKAKGNSQLHFQRVENSSANPIDLRLTVTELTQEWKVEFLACLLEWDFFQNNLGNFCHFAYQLV